MTSSLAVVRLNLFDERRWVLARYALLAFVDADADADADVDDDVALLFRLLEVEIDRDDSLSFILALLVLLWPSSRER